MTIKVHDFHDGNLYFQERFDTRRIADKLAERAKDTLSSEDREVIEQADMFFLATSDHRGMPTCSYKGGDPGFITVVDDSTIAYPNYDGNGKYQSMGNVLKNDNVGLLFVDFVNQSRMRLQGVASTHEDDVLMPNYPGAQFIVRIAISEVYPNCARYVHKYELVERSQYVPRAGKEVPTPEWKQRDEIKGLLPASDPSREG